MVLDLINIFIYLFNITYLLLAAIIVKRLYNELKRNGFTEYAIILVILLGFCIFLLTVIAYSIMNITLLDMQPVTKIINTLCT